MTQPDHPTSERLATLRREVADLLREMPDGALGERVARIAAELENVATQTSAQLRDSLQRQTRESAAWTEAVFEAAVEGIIAIDRRGIIRSVNPAAQRLFGYSADEMIGKNVSILMPPPFQTEHDGYLDHYLQTGEKKIIGIGREVEGRRKDGSVFPMELAVAELKVEAEAAFVGTVRDITARKETAESLRREYAFTESLLETARALILVLDPQGRILRFNRYVEEVSGISLRQARGQDWFDTFLAEADREPTRAIFRQSLGGRRSDGQVTPLVTREGDTRQIEWHDAPLLDGDGSQVGILAVGQDITERMQLEERLRHGQKMEAIGRLAGGVAHDFNTLLGTITGYSEMLLERLDALDGLRRPAEQIHRSAKRGADLTRQLLAFSRRQRLEPEVLDLNDLVRDMDELLYRLVGESVEMVCELSEGERWVRVDPGQLEQVIMNLVVNAFDATPSGGRITLRTASAPPADGARKGGNPRVLLEVRDTGCGIEPDVMPRIFEPFFTTKPKGKGTGLGLSTVYGIVKQSGGDLTVDSEPGQGAGFRITLPAAQAGPRHRSRTAATEPPEAGSEWILVVEDDTVFLDLLTEILRRKGYRVLAARDGEQAIALSQRHDSSMELLLTDMVMPGLTGVELAETLRGRHPRLRVLLMSGYTEDALVDRNATAPGFAFIQKPFETADLLRQIRRLLDQDREPNPEPNPEPNSEETTADPPPRPPG